jgi:rubrerythrin
MNDEILKKLEQRLDRRSFLRGSSFAAVGLLGSALPGLAAAQTPAPQEKPAEKPAENKTPEKKEEKPAEKPAEPGKKEEEEDPFKVTKLDEKGKPYRVCPQCGYNMYQQDKLWSCENCGYSYTE